MHFTEPQRANDLPKFFHYSTPILNLLTGALALNLKPSVAHHSRHLPV